MLDSNFSYIRFFLRLKKFLNFKDYRGNANTVLLSLVQISQQHLWRPSYRISIQSSSIVLAAPYWRHWTEKTPGFICVGVTYFPMSNCMWFTRIFAFSLNNSHLINIAYMRHARCHYLSMDEWTCDANCIYSLIYFRSH